MFEICYKHGLIKMYIRTRVNTILCTIKIDFSVKLPEVELSEIDYNMSYKI